MESRELYKQKYQAQLHEWSARLDLMKARAEKFTAQSKLDVKPHLDAAQSKLEDAKARLEKISEATDEKWDHVAKDIDHAWTDFKAAVEGAYDAMKND